MIVKDKKLPTLCVRNLTVTFGARDHANKAVDSISFDIFPGEVVCLVGESGSGKSATAFATMGLLPKYARFEADTLLLNGKSLLSLNDKQMCSVRGSEMSLIFQEPMTALNPTFKVGKQIAEIIILHKGVSYSKAWDMAVQWMQKVGIHDASQRANAYPHELSGGMRQRVMIAMACCLSPSLIIADEPTTALDVTVQEQILKLLFEIQEQTGAAVLFITHDLAVVAEIADRVLVMQKGHLVEDGDVLSIFESPKHDYTQSLLSAVTDLMAKA